MNRKKKREDKNRTYIVKLYRIAFAMNGVSGGLCVVDSGNYECEYKYDGDFRLVCVARKMVSEKK